jgi:ubiquinone/menaquinone biosynthesis C-methylase UbiE
VSMSRESEQAKYQNCYQAPNYRMGQIRMKDALTDLDGCSRGSYLDIGCGRGEMLTHAEGMGFAPVQGVEVVPDLIDGVRVVRGEAHALPFADNSFDVVSLFDVIEHLVPGDDEAVCREMARVARKHVVLTANNKPSHCPITKADLHINRRPYEEWDALFREWFSGSVTWLKGNRTYVSQGWRIDF